MTVAVINKGSFQTGTYQNVTSIAYNASTRVYTITYGSNSTATHSADSYYISILWT